LKRRVIYRDYRPGRQGKFASRESFNRSQAQGTTSHIHREYIDVDLVHIDSLDDLWGYEDYEDYDYDEFEFHGTGDTGKKKGK